jgi:hypothetical protein
MDVINNATRLLSPKQFVLAKMEKLNKVTQIGEDKHLIEEKRI